MMAKDPYGNPIYLTGTPDENEATLKKIYARAKFSADYAKAKGWPEDVTKLTLPQIMEIRSQPGWESAQ